MLDVRHSTRAVKRFVLRSCDYGKYNNMLGLDLAKRNVVNKMCTRVFAFDETIALIVRR